MKRCNSIKHTNHHSLISLCVQCSPEVVVSLLVNQVNITKVSKLNIYCVVYEAQRAFRFLNVNTYYFSILNPSVLLME